MRRIDINEKNYVIPLCKDRSGKKGELVCFYNKYPENILIEIKGTILRYGVPAGGFWYCVLADHEFVVAFDTIYREKDGSWQNHGEIKEFISGPLKMNKDGHAEVAGYQAPDLVYLKNQVGITAEGKLYAAKGKDVPVDMQFILGDEEGDFCITSKRNIYCKDYTSARDRKNLMKQSDCIYLKNEQIVDIKSTYDAYVAMGACGELFFSYDGKQWDKEPDVTVTAIGADANSVFAANIDGTIDQYTYDRQMEKLHRTEKIETSEKHIAELVLWGNGIGWQTADATFEVLELDENGKYKSIKERK